MGSTDDTGTRLERLSRNLGPLLAGPALLVLFVGGIYAIGDAVLAPAPSPDHPGFVDTVLGSRAVVAAIRLAVIFAAAFVVVSVVALVARGQWLTRIGPVQVAEPVSELRVSRQQLDAVLGMARETVESMGKDSSEAGSFEPRDQDKEGIE